MEGRIDIIFMCVKFGDDPISSLDFSFIGGDVPLKKMDVPDLGVFRDPSKLHLLDYKSFRNTLPYNF